MTLPLLLAAAGSALLGVAASIPRGRTDRPPRWPARVDPRARAADPAVRLAMAAALAALETPWSLAVLRGALAEETDPGVRAALAGSAAPREPPFRADGYGTERASAPF